jgi:CheY-like chemotaxis protein
MNTRREDLHHFLPKISHGNDAGILGNSGGLLLGSLPPDDLRWDLLENMQAHFEGIIASLSFVVVDDVRATCEMIRALLRALGAAPGKVTICASLAEAKRRIQGPAPDVIIGDLYLRDGSGLDLLQLVRGTPSISHTIFLLISNDLKREVIKQAKQLGVSSVLTKPLSFSQLQEHLLYSLLTQGVQGNSVSGNEPNGQSPEQQLLARLSIISRKLAARATQISKKRSP